MKKFAIIAVALCAAFIMAAPAMAIDADFSGYYFVRGFYDSHYGLQDSDSSSAYMDMELELNTVFKVSDNLSLTTRIMGLSFKKWGADMEEGENDLGVDHLYMTIKTDFGKFDIGRMDGGTFGTSFGDSEYENDRIKYTKVIDDLTLVAVYQKQAENDAGLDVADEDKDIYWLIGVYKTEDIAAGLMYGFVNDKTDYNDDPEMATYRNSTSKFHVLDPYFTAKFGPLALQGELVYLFGDTEYDDGTVDLDKKELAWNLEATYDLEMASVQAGYAFFSGDEDPTADDDKAFSGWGGDRLWEKLFILTTDENEYLAQHLGESAVGADDAGNLSQDGYPECGANIYYVGADVTPIENLKLGLLIGYAEADKVEAGVEDDFGWEYDLTLDWKIMDNLTYSAIAAYLDAGDIWKDGDATVDVENTYALFHQLELTF